MLNTCAWLKRLFIVTSKIMIGIQLHIYPIIRRHHFANQSPYSQSYGFSSRHIQMWELDLKEGRMSKNWCLWISAGDDSWESLWLQRKTSQSYRKSTLNTYWKDWCWTWSSNTLATWCEEQTHWKRPDAGKDWRQKEKRVAENERVRYHHQLNDMNLSKLQEMGKDREAWRAAVQGVAGSLIQLSNWTTTTGNRKSLLGQNKIVHIALVVQLPSRVPCKASFKGTTRFKCFLCESA